MKIFETTHLLVRQFTAADADSFFLINGNEQVMRYIRPAKSREDSDAFLEENIRLYAANPGAGRWAVAEKSNGQVIGMFSLLPVQGGAGKLHIGYALLPAYWGKGYATTLLEAGCAHFFGSHPRTTLYAITRQENVASEKVLLKCGFRFSELFAEHERLWKKEPVFY
ncbi:GNAT family N-acetyltransferase [Chitinophaga japonensis]|uniref:Ribosomal-protein-alanine N-acetyltransferase n=1 Tax=Chitinophaga japonensis TaxID=104662 RepID=A0A562T8T8_CHIJA|nr:GNAT family N-acetyltransferase [Chitinophaga japonensis]TWI89240.1 ribosomal-protein-alanine N-acetyltransferase [Chitinophaga japonensis]